MAATESDNVQMPIDPGPVIGFILGTLVLFLLFRKKIQKLVRINLEQLIGEDFFDLTPDLLLISDLEGKILRLNTAFEHALESSQNELVGRKFLEFVHPEDLEKTLGALAGLNSGKTILSFQNRYVAASGNTVHLDWTARPILEKKLVYAVARDISSTKAIEKSLKEAQLKSEVSSKLASLGEMASGIAHEINNPLTVIASQAEDLIDSVKASAVSREQIIETLGDMNAMVFRIAKIVRALKTYSRDASNDPHSESSVETIVEDTSRLCSEKFKHADIDLRIDTISPDLWIECRPAEISNILLNLLTNAKDAIESWSEKWIHLSTKDLGDHVEIAVTNSGPKITVEVRARMFEPFFSTKEVGKGTGLGLSISRTFAESHGGTLLLDDSSKQTSFVVKLPKRQPPMTPKLKEAG